MRLISVKVVCMGGGGGGGTRRISTSPEPVTLYIDLLRKSYITFL